MTNMLEMLQQIEREKGVSLEALVDAMQQALLSAYKRKYGQSGSVRVTLDTTKGDFRVYAQKTVGEQAANPHTEITWREARKVDPKINLGEFIEIEVTPEDFGRIAAQTAKQVILQRIREAERESVYDEFAGKEGELINAEVQRKERSNVFVHIGRVEAILPRSEQVHSEGYRFGERLKLYLLEVRKNPRTPQIVVSRTHPNLVRRLFELEVPEIRDGVVELKAIAREAGARTKLAVHSTEANVDPIGACVGQRGQRVQAVVDELSGEKIDIIRWSEDSIEFIKQSLSPARVSSVVLNEGDRSALVIVAEDQQSLAIGRLGQNVRLAARLTGWKLDIRTQAKHDEELRAAVAAATAAEVIAGPEEAVATEEQLIVIEAPSEAVAAEEQLIVIEASSEAVATEELIVIEAPSEAVATVATQDGS